MASLTPDCFSGKSSQKIKEGLIVKLLAASKGNETGYVIRSLQVSALEYGSCTVLVDVI